MGTVANRKTLTKRLGYVEVDQDRCKGCGLCVVTCAKSALALSARLNSRGHTPMHVKKPARCTDCALCALMCPDVAIGVYRTKSG